MSKSYEKSRPILYECLNGKVINIEQILNIPIIITAYRVVPSDYFNPEGYRLMMTVVQFHYEAGIRVDHVFRTNSKYIRRSLRNYHAHHKKKPMSYRAVIVKDKYDAYRFEGHEPDPVTVGPRVGVPVMVNGYR